MKNNVIHEIIELLSQKRSLSSPDLTKALNVSSSTITKYTSYLVEAGILKTTYSNAKKGDVKSTRFNLHPAKYFMIYDLSGEDYKILACALTGRIKKEYTYKPYKSKDFYENKYNFIKIANSIISKQGKSKNVGTAVVLSDTYDNNLILKSRITALVNELPSAKFIRVDRKRQICAELLKSTLSPSDFALCLFLNKNNFCSCYLTSTTDINNLTFGEIGESYKIKEIPLIDYVDYMEEPEDVINAFYNIISDIISTVPINKIAIIGNLYPHLKALKEILQEKFSDKGLEFYYFDHDNYAPYLAKELRSNLTKDLIATYLNK